MTIVSQKWSQQGELVCTTTYIEVCMTQNGHILEGGSGKQEFNVSTLERYE